MGFECKCDSGYVGDGVNVCHDVDECSTHNPDLQDECDANAQCINTVGSYGCFCNSGYSMQNNECENVDECALNLHDCNINADCTDVDGSYGCACKDGFSGDGIMCYDVDECSEGSDTCDPFTELCTNTHGSYECSPINCRDIKSSSKVQCDHNGIRVSFPKCVFQFYKMSDWYLDGPIVSTGDNVGNDCRVKNFTESDAWISWEVRNDENSCNTMMQNNGTHLVYANAVQKTEDWGSNMVISRGTGRIVRFHCSYAMTQHLSLVYGLTCLFVCFIYLLLEMEFQQCRRWKRSCSPQDRVITI